VTAELSTEAQIEAADQKRGGKSAWAKLGTKISGNSCKFSECLSVNGAKDFETVPFGKRLRGTVIVCVNMASN
jgi:hypothetical protein